MTNSIADLNDYIDEIYPKRYCGHVLIVEFSDPVYFNPKELPELIDLGAWSVSRNHQEYFLTGNLDDETEAIVSKTITKLNLGIFKVIDNISLYHVEHDGSF